MAGSGVIRGCDAWGESSPIVNTRFYQPRGLPGESESNAKNFHETVLASRVAVIGRQA
jgi:hypothetical protein